MTTSLNYPSLLDPLDLPELTRAGIHADVLRLDRIHPVISGNKWFKLKGHLAVAKETHASALLTFGGAWSNHIIATAYAAQQLGMPAIGIIRGERPLHPSATLIAASGYGMQLEFISRDDYRKKEEATFLQQLSSRYPGVYMIPEGGAGTPGSHGCEDLLRGWDTKGYSHICCAIGTGTMFQGLARAIIPSQQLIGIAVLKGMHSLPVTVHHTPPFPEPPGSHIITGYHFGGYARHTPALLEFMNRFYRDTHIPSDLVYTGKLFYAILDMTRREFFPARSRLLIIHSGGLQGNGSLPPGTLLFHS